MGDRRRVGERRHRRRPPAADLGDPIPPSAADHAGLVVMGGPMSASSDDGFATRRAELALLSDAMTSGKPTLGVCLGAQLPAVAGGGRVRPVSTDRRSAGRLSNCTRRGRGRCAPGGAAPSHSTCCTGTATRTTATGVGATGDQRALLEPGVPGRWTRRGVSSSTWRSRTRAVDAFVDAFADEAGCAPGGARPRCGAPPRASSNGSAPGSSWSSTGSPRWSAVHTGMNLGTVSRTFPVRKL